MRFLNLTVRNFRGFGNDPVTIDFDGELILFFGPNGFGKTSLSEAIEWLFYGTTKRRRRGDDLNRTEYLGSFCNAHGGMPVEVTARVQLPGHGEHRLSRRIDANQGEQGITFVDGVQADFTALGLRPIEAVYPIVAQHGLQTFVHTRPRDRRDAISAAFGLDELAELKVALDGARRSFNLNPPPAVTQARTKLRGLGAELAGMPQLAGMGQRWQRAPHPQVNTLEDLAALKTAAGTIAGEQSDDVESLLAGLRTRREELARQVFKSATLMPPADSDARWARVTAIAEGVGRNTGELAQAVATAVAGAAAYAAERLALWEKGLGIAPAGDQCPMCEADTLTPVKRAELQGRLDSAHASVAANKRIVELSGQAATAVGQLTDAIAQALRPGMSGADPAVLERLFSGEPAAIAPFVAANDALVAATASMKAAAAALIAHLRSISARLGDPRNAPAVVADGEALPRAFAISVAALEEGARRYRTQWRAFEPVLSSRIASSEQLARIDAIDKALRATPEIGHLAAYDLVLERSQGLMQSVEAALRTHQEALLATRGGEISALYDLMNQGSDVRFARMVPATDSLKLEATSFGVAMSAAANLSECQLNCLGLAVALMQATTPNSPFGFVLLDDPVQAMDDQHCEAFLASVLPQLLEQHGKQVIVLSHLTPIVDRSRALSIDRRVRVYHFENYLRTGPVIVEQVKLQKKISEIKGLMVGNDANRELAVDRLRVLVEAMVRELHTQKVGPVPPQFDTATPAQLLALFRSIPDTLPKEHQGLSDTVDFCDPAHHTDATYTVPTRGNIQPHLDRVQGLIAKYGL
jgi:energy-coupling factor transporter ATP-binding protein EcfA2